MSPSSLLAVALATNAIAPQSVVTNSAGRVLFDFGEEWFGWAEVRGEGTAHIRLGELKTAENSVEMNPGATIRAIEVAVELPADPPPPLLADDGWLRVDIPADKRNTTGAKEGLAARLPKEIGVVMPFRYAEAPVGVDVRMVAATAPIDRDASRFSCDDPRLQKVYDFCKHSIVATSFAGLYIDGDRERIPYEADAYINMLGEQAVWSDGTIAKRTLLYLLDHPTWPTEWHLHMPMMAHDYWMATGDIETIRQCYDRLVPLLLRDKAREKDGLLATPRRPGRKDAPGFNIVDWPECERDGFVFRDVNAVVNAFHIRALCDMAEIAAALGKSDDAALFSREAEEKKAAFREVFIDDDSNIVRDGEGARHSSLHANAAALAFGLTDAGWTLCASDFCVKRGMACSPYFAQYLLEGLFKAGRDDEAIALMTSGGERSWLGMMDAGATITMEAWSRRVKPNLDMNHAWGTAPLNVISRFVLGVTPIEPGFAKIMVKPQTGQLKRIDGIVPTPHGPVSVKIENGTLTLETPVPAIVEFGSRLREVSPGRHVFDRES